MNGKLLYCEVLDSSVVYCRLSQRVCVLLMFWPGAGCWEFIAYLDNSSEPLGSVSIFLPGVMSEDGCTQYHHVYHRHVFSVLWRLCRRLVLDADTPPEVRRALALDAT